ncbi:hypothetical protein QUB75_01935 [Microcoleus sp. K1-B6]|uniref:hypothetical protein n=1 Tax=unclassified Microcoleus TaxID=2642155 RepID=UPI002FD35C5F
MIISDLNYLEVVQQENIVGGISDYEASTYLTFYEDVYIEKDFCVESYVSGISAFAEADAVAYGYNAHAEALSFTYTDECMASASATSFSASS